MNFMVYHVLLLTAVYCFVLSSFAEDIPNNRESNLQRHDFTLDGINTGNIREYISKIVSDVVETHSDEIKALKGLVESQGRQIKSLENDKLDFISVIKILESRVENLEEKTVQVGSQERRDQIADVPADADDTSSGKDLHKPGRGLSQSATIKKINGHQNRIRRGGYGYRVAFFARMKTKTQHVLQNQIVPFDDVVTNVGGGFNESIGKFAAPYAGTYVFSITIGHESGADTSATFMVNGTPLAKVIVNEEQATQIIVMNLKVGDVVALQNSEMERDYTGEGYNSFNGFLLYEEIPVTQVVG